MLVIDTSALLAVLQGEPECEAIVAQCAFNRPLLISAGTMTEALIVASRRNLLSRMEDLLKGLDPHIIDVDAATAHRIVDIYQRWGKGNHPARLNFGDCFAYDLARQRQCPLLFIGQDFAQTDVTPALS